MLNDCHQAVCAYGNIDLDSNGILGSAPELLDFEVLLQPFEKQFHLPSVLIKFSHLERRDLGGIGQEHKLTVLLLIPVSDQTKRPGIILLRIKAGQLDGHIRKDFPRQPAFPFDGLVLKVLLCPDNEVGPYLMDPL